MIKIFGDGADLESIKRLNNDPQIDGFTTNPSLMAKAGITDYEAFAKEVLKITNKPVSFEVFDDDLKEMGRQAEIISSWGDNVYVKIPITNTKGESSVGLIGELLNKGIKVNATAITAPQQAYSLPVSSTPMIVSIFAGRIADTGVDPFPIMRELSEKMLGNVELLWASPREVLNIYQAEQAGCHIITCTPDLIDKYNKLKGKNLVEYSRETVQMFYNDAVKSGFKL